MTGGPVVSDSSPLIALSRIGRLDLLQRLFGTVTIPPAVAREVFAAQDPPPWLHVVAPSTGAEGVASATLGAGELEAIRLAADLHCQRLLLDDLPARRLAARRALPVSGTVAVLLAAKRAGLVPAVKPLLDALRSVGFHLAERVRVAAVAACGEDDPG
jgi:hypothetical protein